MIVCINFITPTYKILYSKRSKHGRGLTTANGPLLLILSTFVHFHYTKSYLVVWIIKSHFSYTYKKKHTKKTSIQLICGDSKGKRFKFKRIFVSNWFQLNRFISMYGLASFVYKQWYSETTTIHKFIIRIHITNKQQLLFKITFLFTRTSINLPKLFNT